MHELVAASDDWRLVRSLREELYLLQEPSSYIGEVVKAMGKKKVLVKASVYGVSLARLTNIRDHPGAT